MNWLSGLKPEIHSMPSKTVNDCVCLVLRQINNLGKKVEEDID